MAKSRTKKLIIVGVSEADFNENLSKHSETDAKLRKILATMDTKIQKIRDQYKDEITSLDKIKNEAFDVCMTYATENEQLFEKKRSIDTPFGVVGFRTGNKKVLQRSGYSVKKTLDLMRSKLPKFIETKESVNKAGILADKKLTEEKLKEVGLRIIQDESFYIDLKTEEAE